MIKKYLFHTINPDCTFIVSGKVRDEKENGEVLWATTIHSKTFDNPLLIPVEEHRIDKALNQVVELYANNPNFRQTNKFFNKTR